jgi:hypothetical protein
MLYGLTPGIADWFANFDDGEWSSQAMSAYMATERENLAFPPTSSCSSTSC